MLTRRPTKPCGGKAPSCQKGSCTAREKVKSQSRSPRQSCCPLPPSLAAAGTLLQLPRARAPPRLKSSPCFLVGAFSFGAVSSPSAQGAQRCTELGDVAPHPITSLQQCLNQVTGNLLAGCTRGPFPAAPAARPGCQQPGPRGYESPAGAPPETMGQERGLSASTAQQRLSGGRISPHAISSSAGAALGSGAQGSRSAHTPHSFPSAVPEGWGCSGPPRAASVPLADPRTSGALLAIESSPSPWGCGDRGAQAFALSGSRKNGFFYFFLKL